MFNWLFGNKSIKTDCTLPQDALGDDTSVKIVEVVQKKEKTYNLKEDLFDKFPYLRDWYDGLPMKASMDRSEGLRKRDNLMVSIGGISGKISFIFRDIFVMDNDKFYKIKRYADGYTPLYYTLVQLNVEPPVVRLIKDMYNNFCDWEYKYITELEDVSIKKLVHKPEYYHNSHIEPFNNFGVDTAKLMYIKNNIIVDNSMEFGCNGWIYSCARLTVNDTTIKLNEDESSLILEVTGHHKDNIAEEHQQYLREVKNTKRYEMDKLLEGML